MYNIHGEVVAYGTNTNGQCDIPDGLIATKISTGYASSIILKPDGKVVVISTDTTFKPPSNLIAKDISASQESFLAIRPDGTAVAWGSNRWYTCNLPSSLNSPLCIDGGYRHSLAITQNNDVLAWGLNEAGVMGVPSGLKAIKVQGGYRHSIALKADGNVVCWGDTSERTVPSNVKAIDIAGGAYSTIIMKPDRTIAVYGTSVYGTYDNVSTNVPAFAIEGSHRATYIIELDGTVRGWIHRTGGSTPLPPLPPSNVKCVAISSHYTHLLAIKGTPLITSFTTDTQITNTNKTVQFLDTSIGSPYQWLWDFGDGETSTEQHPYHRYREPGIYTITLTTTNVSGMDTKMERDFIVVEKGSTNRRSGVVFMPPSVAIV